MHVRQARTQTRLDGDSGGDRFGSSSPGSPTTKAPFRASLAGSQIVGVVMARHIVLIEPLASIEEERLVEALAPTIQRYLCGPLRSRT